MAEQQTALDARTLEWVLQELVPLFQARQELHNRPQARGDYSLGQAHEAREIRREVIDLLHDKIQELSANG